MTTDQGGGSVMPAKSGAQYISRLSQIHPEVWIRGERIEYVTTPPALRNGLRSVPQLYGMRPEPELGYEIA